MDRTETVLLMKEIFNINKKIDDLTKKRDKIQGVLNEKCNNDGHLMVCYCIRDEFAVYDEFIGTSYELKCLICGFTKTLYYRGLHSDEINNGLYECNHLIEIAMCLINSNINEANRILKEKECKYDITEKKLKYMSNILEEIGYTIDMDTNIIIPINK